MLPFSFQNVKNVLLKELRANQPKAHILLVGTKADLRGRPRPQGEAAAAGSKRTEEVKPVLLERTTQNMYYFFAQVAIRKIRRLLKEEKLSGYVETSAIRGGGDVDRVFHEAIRISLGKPSQGTLEDSDWSGGCQFL